MEVFFTKSDGARRIGCTPSWFGQLCRSGRISPVARTFGGQELFSPEDVDELADERRRKAERRSARWAAEGDDAGSAD